MVIEIEDDGPGIPAEIQPRMTHYSSLSEIVTTKPPGQGTGLGVRREYAPDLPNIQANGSELNQVWTNIIDNAADALQGQGEITIRTRHEGEWVVIEIEDDGPGIPAEIQPRVFEPFYTTKPPGQGTGLGLDISYNVVAHNHRGDINVFSEPGKTCFRVRLPVNAPPTKAR